MKRRLTGLTNDDRVAELIEESIDIQDHQGSQGRQKDH